VSVHNKTTILGLHIGKNDSSAALIEEGRLIAASQESSFRDSVCLAPFPIKSIQYCLQEAGIKPKNVELVALSNNSPTSIKNFLLKLHYPRLKIFEKNQKILESHPLPYQTVLRNLGLNCRVQRISHPVAHLMNVRYQLPEDNVALISLDGVGDTISTMAGEASENEFEVLSKIYFPHSLGIFYEAMTQYMGFIHSNDQYKLMEYSQYGKPKFLPALRQVIRERKNFGFDLNLEVFCFHKKCESISYDNGRVKFNPYFRTALMTQMIGLPPRKPSDKLTEIYFDFAKSVQMRFEEISNHLLTELSKMVSTKNLAVSGGCAKNQIWVGKILEKSPFKKLVVSPSSTDIGLSIGAAIAAAKTAIHSHRKNWIYLGAKFEEQEKQNKKIENIVEQLLEEKPVMFKQGFQSFSTHTLQSDSILIDPRNTKLIKKICKKLEKPEKELLKTVMINQEYQTEWFEKSFYSPAAQAKFALKPTFLSKVPTIMNPENLCAVQTISENDQPFLWKLVEAFRKKTQIPLLVCIAKPKELSLEDLMSDKPEKSSSKEDSLPLAS
jgi:carbamoyltransferase